MKLPKEMGSHWPGEPLRFTYAMVCAVAAASIAQSIFTRGLYEYGLFDDTRLIAAALTSSGAVASAVLLAFARISPATVVSAGLGLLSACLIFAKSGLVLPAYTAAALSGAIVSAGFVYVGRAPQAKSFALLLAAPGLIGLTATLLRRASPTITDGTAVDADIVGLILFAVALVLFGSAVIWGRRSAQGSPMVEPADERTPLWAALAALAAIGVLAIAGTYADATRFAYWDTFDRDSFSPEGYAAHLLRGDHLLALATLIGLVVGAQLATTLALGPRIRRIAVLTIISLAGVAAFWAVSVSPDSAILLTACTLFAAMAIWKPPVFAALRMRGWTRDIVIGVAVAIPAAVACCFAAVRATNPDFDTRDAPPWLPAGALLIVMLFALPLFLTRGKRRANAPVRHAVVNLARTIQSKRAIEVGQAVLLIAVVSQVLLLSVLWRGVSSPLSLQPSLWPWLLGAAVGFAVLLAWLVCRALLRSAAPVGAAVAVFLIFGLGGLFIASQAGAAEFSRAVNAGAVAVIAAFVVSILQFLPVGALVGMLNYARHTAVAAPDRERVLSTLDRPRDAWLALLEPLLLWRGYRAPRLAGLGASVLAGIASLFTALAALFVLPAFGFFAVVVVFGVVRFLEAFASQGLVGAIVALVVSLTLLVIVLPMIPIGLAIGAIGGWLKSLARLIMRQTYASLAARDERPPILFLRSFSNDQFEISNKGALDRAMRGLPRKSKLDHLLVENFSRYGPVVAIGRPGDKDLPFGAARLYVTDEHWKNEVLRMANEARAIVIVLEDAHGGLGWEIETVTKSFGDKTLFLTHHGAGAPDMFADWMEQQADARPGTDGIAHFTLASGAWLSLEAQAPSADAYELALRAFFRRERLQLSSA